LRVLLLLLAASASARADDRLGTLIRWYLDERTPARKWEFVEAIERIAQGDPEVVAQAIRSGAYAIRPPAPALRSDAPLPSLDGKRVTLFPAAACAGHFATLLLPEGYDPAKPWPLVIDLETSFPPPRGCLVAAMKSLPSRYPAGVQAAESALFSLLAHLYETCHVDPARVYLQGELETASLAWYVVLHNPDRFAGAITAGGSWDEGLDLAVNGKRFSLLAVDPRRALFDALVKANPAHQRLTRPDRPADLVPAFETWMRAASRAPAPPSISLANDRPEAIRCYWLRAAPAVRSEQQMKMGEWTHRGMRRVATIDASIGEGNLVTVRAHHVAAFDLYIDPRLLDPRKPVRVSINGAVPEARAPDPSVADLLEDFRERRDPALLYHGKLTFAVPGG